MVNILKKIRVFFLSIFFSFKKIDNLLVNSNKETDNKIDGSLSIEQESESKSVYDDLLRGEVTERVRELRHEMYYSERKSKEYLYIGNGLVKKNTMFDYTGKIDRTEDLKIFLVQENKVITSSFSDFNDESDFRNKSESEKERVLKVERDFIPRFRLENYTNKIVVKQINEEKYLIDFYVSAYEGKWEPTRRMFHKEMDRIYQGYLDNHTTDIHKIKFTTKDAFGSPDLVEFSFNNLKYDNIVLFDGNYVLKFLADLEYRNDLIDEFYDEKTAEKCAKKERRENSTISFFDIQ